MIAQDRKASFEQDGYIVERGLFSEEETAFYRDHYMHLRSSGTYWGDFEGVDPTSNDPWKRYPRMIHMHRWDEASLRWMIEPRINAVLTEVAGEEPLAVQTMLYFKPAGARGQALHQDQFYLRAKPGTCLAAWMALDACDIENGCMQVVPGSHRWELLCTAKADITQSFTDVTVPLPEDTDPVPVVMQPGDVLFFHGLLVHGSFPNTSTDRFRRALIGHYITGDAREVANFYHPILRMDGTEVPLEESPEGSRCGIWVDGHIEMHDVIAEDLHE